MPVLCVNVHLSECPGDKYSHVNCTACLCEHSMVLTSVCNVCEHVCVMCVYVYVMCVCV